MTKIALIGAGGHAKVVYEAMIASGHTDISVYDDDMAKKGTAFLDTVIQGPYDGTADLIHLAFGSDNIRQKLADKYQQKLLTVIHPDATISPSAELEEGIFIAAQAVVGPEARLGKSVIINHGAVVDHDCDVGAFSHIAPRATLTGGVKIGAHCLVGASSTVLPNIHIEEANIIGAGAVITKNIIEMNQKIKGVA